MTTLNISITQEMREWIDAKVSTGKYANASDYMRDLIRYNQKERELTTGELNLTRFMHLAHLLFLREMPRNTLDYFLKVLKSIDSKERENIIFSAYTILPGLEVRKPKSLDETLGELITTDFSLSAFEDKCKEFAKHIGERFLVFGLTHHLLQSLFHQADVVNREWFVNNFRTTIEGLKGKIEEEKDPTEIASTKEFIEDMEGRIDNIDNSMNESYRYYESFCRKVVFPLLNEEIPVPHLNIGVS